MCDACTQSAYEMGEEALEEAEQEIVILSEALQEIADLHTGDWTPTRLVDGAALCKGCDSWWPCVTFLTAVGALNDAR